MLFTYSTGSFVHNGKEYGDITHAAVNEALHNGEEVFSKDTSIAELINSIGAAGGEVVETPLQFLGFEGKPAGYMIIFCVCAVAYLIGWVVMKTLVPKYKPVVLED